jgi:hypothetical protein
MLPFAFYSDINNLPISAFAVRHCAHLFLSLSLFLSLFLLSL